jgi:type III pantothenate kinase
MRLLIDIGNTRIKWALQRQEGLSLQQAVAHHGLTVQHVTDQILKSSESVDAVLISNVAGPLIAAIFRQAISDYWGHEPTFVTSKPECTVQGRVLRNAYQEPSQLGVDRWLAMIGARSLLANPVLVVSVGTAMTLDAINEQGQHLGGLIVPGLDLMRQSLLQHTSDLSTRSAQVDAGQSDSSFFANNTLEGIQLGAVRAASSVVEAAYQQLQQLADTRVLLTGGAAADLQQKISIKSEVIPDLVLQGLLQYD